MKPSLVFLIAWRGLNRNKFRSLLTMLGVIIGVAAVIVMVSISAGTEAAIAERISRLGTNLIFIQAQRPHGMPGREGRPPPGGLVYDDAFAIGERIDGVEGVVIEEDSSQTIQYESITIEEVEILGTTTDFPAVRDMTLNAGRFFNQTDLDRKAKVAILGSSLAKNIFPDGAALGKVIQIGNTKIAVIGVFSPKGMVGNDDYDGRIYVPITLVFQKFIPSQFAHFMGDRVRLIYVKLGDGYDQQGVIYQIEQLLLRRHDLTVDTADFAISTQQNLISTQEATTAAFRNLLAWVAAVSLVVGGIGIMNIMMVSVTERTREIGIRQSVGASPADIRWQFLTEALLLSLVGGLFGVILGIGGSWLFGLLGGMRTVIVSSSILVAFCSAALVGIFFGFYPANKASQLDPIEALRHE